MATIRRGGGSLAIRHAAAQAGQPLIDGGQAGVRKSLEGSAIEIPLDLLRAFVQEKGFDGPPPVKSLQAEQTIAEELAEFGVS